MEPATNALLEQMTGRPQNASRPPLHIAPIDVPQVLAARPESQLTPISAPSAVQSSLRLSSISSSSLPAGAAPINTPSLPAGAAPSLAPINAPFLPAATAIVKTDAKRVQP
jgi:hypothetical protein